ncbi:MAG TPA: tetratricopeptide repeat protein [Candidatus Aquicultor sp.]|jgi:tetratricopeptide (TPR) repeat protein
MEGNFRKILVYVTIFLTVAIIAILAIMLKQVFSSQSVPQNPADQAYIVAKALTTKNPKDADGWFRLAKAEADMGRTGDAVSHFKKAIELKPAAPMLHYTLGLVLEDSGKEEEAIKEYQNELRVTEGKNELALYELGRIANKRKQFTQAVAYLQQALVRMAGGADAHYELGKAYVGLGKDDLAMKEFNETLRYIPDHTDAQIAIQQLQMKKVGATGTTGTNGKTTTTTVPNKK